MCTHQCAHVCAHHVLARVLTMCSRVCSPCARVRAHYVLIMCSCACSPCARARAHHVLARVLTMCSPCAHVPVLVLTMCSPCAHASAHHVLTCARAHHMLAKSQNKLAGCNIKLTQREMEASNHGMQYISTMRFRAFSPERDVKPLVQSSCQSTWHFLGENGSLGRWNFSPPLAES